MTLLEEGILAESFGVRVNASLWGISLKRYVIFTMGNGIVRRRNRIQKALMESQQVGVGRIGETG